MRKFTLLFSMLIMGLITLNAQDLETKFTYFNVVGQVSGTTVIGDGTISFKMNEDADLSALTTQFTLSEGATAKINEVAQVSGTTVDFSNGSVTYTVTNGSNTQQWVVSVVAPASSETAILSYSADGQVGETTIGEGIISLTVDASADVSKLVTYFTLSTGASAAINNVAQVSGTVVDFTTGSVTYTITAEDGTTTQDWVVNVGTVSVNENAQLEAEVYPNPANEIVTIKGIENASVTVVSIVGQVIDHIQINGNNNQINTAAYANGTYMLIVESNGKQVVKKVSVIH